MEIYFDLTAPQRPELHLPCFISYTSERTVAVLDLLADAAENRSTEQQPFSSVHSGSDNAEHKELDRPLSDLFIAAGGFDSTSSTTNSPRRTFI